jgi:proton-coupled amino acid transporter
MVIASTIISWLGAADLDKFVALVGCFAWCGIIVISVLQTILISNFSVPLCYCYPPMLHYKAISRTRKQKLADIALIIFGFVAAVYTTIQTLGVRLFSFLKRSSFSPTYTFFGCS